MICHTQMASGRWFEYDLIEQLANVGMDIERTIRHRNAGRIDDAQAAFWRALELIDLTIADPKNRRRLKEVVIARELLVDHFAYDNEWKTTDQEWLTYFYSFNYAVAIRRGK